MYSDASSTLRLSYGCGSYSSTCAPAGTIDSTRMRFPPTFAAMSANSVVVARTSGAPGIAVPAADDAVFGPAQPAINASNRTRDQCRIVCSLVCIENGTQ